MRGLSLIIPAHNAEKFIESSLVKYYSHFSKFFNPFELIVICNGCKDQTLQRVLRLKDLFPLKIIDTPKSGKGYAIRLGLDYSICEIVGFIDADNPYNLSEITRMLDYLNLFDMVMVTKFKYPLKYQTSITRRFFSILGAIVFIFLFNMRFNDTQAGAKFFHKRLWKELKRPFICTGFEFDMELLYKTGKLNAKIKEHYIKPNTTDFSTVKLRILPGLIYRLIKLRLLQ